MPALLTLPQVAQRLGVPAHRVDYVVESRAIEPAGRLGRYRVYGEAEVERIKAALAEADANARPVKAVYKPTLAS
jgi:DNA-binding transcriptional MerR regulator